MSATLNLSAKTVSTYRTRLLQKMRMQNNAELIQYAIRNKLIE
jgi:two-component system invasion response regulator UvrY